MRTIVPARCASRPGLLLATMLPLLVGVASGAAAQSVRDSAWLASKGFYQRDADALLHVTRAEIAMARARSMSDVAALHGRLEARRVAGNRIELWLHATGGGARGNDADGCRLLIYFNGVQVQRGMLGDLYRTMRVRDLDAVEVFEAATAPITDPTGCGALLLWSYDLKHRVDEEFTGYLRGTVVVMPAGSPLGGVSVHLEPAGVHQTTDSAGRFDFGALPAGRHRITLTVPGEEPWAMQVMLRAYSVGDFVLEVEVSG